MLHVTRFVLYQAPANSGSSYYNYKGSHSINLLAVCDANGCFTMVDIGAEGRQGDAGVFANSGLPALLTTNEIRLPPPRCLPGSNMKCPFVILGDEAFPLMTNLMRPYPRSGQLNITRKVYNYRLSRARRVIEGAFGLLAARFRIYRRPIIASTPSVRRIVQATVALHNFAMNQDLARPPNERMYSVMTASDRALISTGLDDIVPVNNDDCENVEPVIHPTTIRNTFADYFEHVSPVPWQWEKAVNNDF